MVVTKCMNINTCGALIVFTLIVFLRRRMYPLEDYFKRMSLRVKKCPEDSRR